jgi:hypothetical protein
MKSQILTALLQLAIIWTLSAAPGTTTLHCPADQTLTCEAQTFNLSLYGEAYIMKDGHQYPAGLASVTKNLNSCNVGTIVRHWSTIDDNNNTIECSQTLTFLAGTFTINNITWPESEVDLVGCDNAATIDSLPSGVDRPTFDYVMCTQVGTSHTDSRFIFGPDCDKIIREWTVIDWCSYKPGHPGGIWRFNQVFKISNGEPATIACPKDLTVNADACNGLDLVLPPATASGEPCRGQYQITNNSVHADTTTQDASGFYPIGTTTILYALEYGCGITASCQTQVTVSDVIRPVPYCLATINVALMPVDTNGDGLTDDGMVDIWAKDVNVNSYHPCNNDSLTFSFDQLAEEMSRTFTCTEVGLNQTRVYVTDEQGRQSFCLVTISIQNNGAQIPDCEAPIAGDGMIVSGMITDPAGNTISGVDVRYRDTETQQVIESNQQSAYHMVPKGRSEENGSYEIHNISSLRIYQVSAYKPGDVTKVTQADIDILERYIRGESTFNNPYTYLAADINEDGQVDINDYHLLRNLFGQEESAWPNQKQWMFFHLDASHTMGEIPSISEFAETKLSQGIHNAMHFFGILKGDLDYYENL